LAGSSSGTASQEQFVMSVANTIAYDRFPSNLPLGVSVEADCAIEPSAFTTAQRRIAGMPRGPVSPFAPCLPEAPGSPFAAAAPGLPLGPCGPVEPRGPVAPGTPRGPLLGRA